jgi:PAS domain S-box-containing protein
MQAHLSYDARLVALSVLIAIGASVVALWLAFLNTGLRQRLVAAVVMGLAIAGMHYTAMLAANFHAHAGADAAHAPASIGQIHLALGVSTATFLLLFLALAAAIFDRRFAMLATREAAMLRESERRFRLLVEGVTDYSIFMLDPAGHITSWNSGAERAKGYRAEEIVGQHVSVFYSKKDRQDGIPERALQTARENGKFEAEGWRVRKDGSRFWASVAINPIHDDTGELLGFAKLTRDVTERREAQRQLAQAQAKLLPSQKMEALGQLTGGVAHDFNNLLAVVLGNLELLRKRLPDNPRPMKLLENAQKGAQRGAALTQRMLAFARRQELKPAAVDVPDLVRGMADLLQRTIGPDVRIETRFPVRLARAQVDAHQLELAIVNLAVNSRDAMPSGGTILIAAEEEALADINALGLPPGRYVALRVTDTGTGMDEPTLARALEPFFTTKGTGRGTGLGLSIVHGLAEQSGGRLVLKSSPGDGTEAEIWLPVSNDETPKQSLPPPETRLAQTERSQHTVCVLVVDDDCLVLEGTVAMLEDLGHTALEASSGQEALAVLHRGERPDLVITDQVMPEMSGSDLAAAIKLHWPHVPVILATGYAELPSNSDAELLKLTKPYSQDTLSWAIAESIKTSPSPEPQHRFPERGEKAA